MPAEGGDAGGDTGGDAEGGEAGGDEELPTTGVDMQGFVLGGAIVTGIGALALWAGSRRPAAIE